MRKRRTCCFRKLWRVVLAYDFFDLSFQGCFVPCSRKSTKFLAIFENDYSWKARDIKLFPNSRVAVKIFEIKIGKFNLFRTFSQSGFRDLMEPWFHSLAVRTVG